MSHTSQINTTPWQAEFNKYLNMSFELGTMTIVKFWSLHASQYLVWASLARDNGIIYDIVKALQFLKYIMQKDLLFWKIEMMQAELEEREEDGSVAEEG
ncbi:hypothetical protein AX16_009443 [Volvariella volvacea WC 439]|nr:hypothetical protein AX16_009443 [Volvariella volvacea WC 439]